jgi:hypothetical protein
LEENQLDQTEASVPEVNLLKVKRAAVEAKDVLEENQLDQTEASVPEVNLLKVKRAAVEAKDV